jgi:hypothetical protein
MVSKAKSLFAVSLYSSYTDPRSSVLSQVPSDTLIGIKYPGGQDVALGNKLTPEEASKAPEVMFVADDPSAYYTLIMVSLICIYN